MLRFHTPARQTGRADFPRPTLRVGARLSHKADRAFAHGSPHDVRAEPSLGRGMPSMGSQPLMEVIGMATLRAVSISCIRLEPRPLRSTGVTRRRHYYGPLRLPARPGLSVAGVRLTAEAVTAQDLPCCVWSPFVSMPASLPRRDPRVLSLVSRGGGSLRPGAKGSTPATSNFEASMTFTDVPAWRLAERPSRSFPEVLRQIRYLLRRSALLLTGATSSSGGTFTH